MQRRCLDAAEHAVRHACHEVLGIPAAVWPLVVKSWERQEPSLYGRMDLRWDGTGPPKLLEYNADTPTALYEAAVVQWEWLTCLFPQADQFNSIHEALISAWLGIALPGGVHFTCQRGSDEDRVTVDYLRDTAMQAGLQVPFLFIDEIGWDGRRFVDLAERPIATCFKLYPWEFLLRDSVRPATSPAPPCAGSSRPGACCCRARGCWRCCGSCSPATPTCCRPSANPAAPAGRKSPSRSGAARAPASPRPGFATPGPYGAEGFVHQAWAELPCADGRYPVLGSWVVAGKPCGLGIREDASPITTDASRFVPHLFNPR